GRKPPIQVPRSKVWPSLEIRFQRRDRHLEGGEIRSGPPDVALQEGRREVFRNHGRAPRQFRHVELDSESVECGQDGSQEGYRRPVAPSAQKEGLRFGVSEHLAVSYHWFQTSHGADKGEFKGVPYDG